MTVAEPVPRATGIATDSAIPSARSRPGPSSWKWWWGLAAFVPGHALPVGVAILVVLAVGPVRVIGVDEVLLVGCLAIAAVWFARRHGRRLRARDFGLRPTPSRAAVGWTVLGYVSYLIAAVIYASAVHRVHGNAPAPHEVHGVAHSVELVLSVAIVAPVGEEFFYRGFLYATLRNRLSVFWSTAIVGSLFGLMHLALGGASPVAIPVLAFIGFVLCLLYERTGSLLPAIALHMVVNGTAASIAITGSPVSALVVIAAVGALFLVAPWRGYRQLKRYSVASPTRR